MKIDIFVIFREHLSTLRDAGNDRLSKSDILTFFLLPALIALGCALRPIYLSKDFYNISITFFGIFIALLLNIQVAIFGIHQRRWEHPDDEILQEFQDKKLAERNNLLKQLNINTSYLVTLACLCLSLFIVLYIVDEKSVYLTAISTYLYSHFILTLLMVVKRTYALFQGEYLAD